MPTHTQTQTPPDPWNPNHPDIWVEHGAGGADGAGGLGPVLHLRHPGHPFSSPSLPAAADDTGLATAVTAHARRYVAAIAARAGLPKAVVKALVSGGPTPEGALGWLPLHWGLRHQKLPQHSPWGSYWLLRYGATAKGEQEIERSAVLLAARCWRDARGHLRPLGDDVGLRVVVQVLRNPGGQVVLRIGGASLSRLAEPAALQPVSATLLGVLAQRDTPAARIWQASLAQATGLQGGVGLLGLYPPQAVPARWYAAGRGHDSRGQAWRFEVEVEANPLAAQPPIHRVMHMAHDRERGAGLNHRRRLAPPDRSIEALAGVSILPNDKAQAGREPLVVLNRQPVRDAGDMARWNDWQAHDAVRGPLARLRAYGLDVTALFRFAQGPLRVVLNAALPGARDGLTINAEVRPRLPDAGPVADERPYLEMAFGHADLRHRLRSTNIKGDAVRRAEYLSLVNDPCWVWHEFSHVLNHASTGALELRFAHGAGDAMAAIAADASPVPRPNGHLPARQDDEGRYLTYPWVQLQRRHDRQAERGWGWCGQRSQVRRAGPQHDPQRRVGYFEEQLMSSALFRLYRSVGGDTPLTPACTQRLSACEYLLYLMARATASLGPDAVAPAASADQFVGALIDADQGTTGAWQVDTTGEGDDGTPVSARVQRQGGRLHKAMRWAFEQQGLYADTWPGQVVEGVGRPPPVDLFIADRRGGPPGDYTPVPLHPPTHRPAPDWLASGQAVRLRGGVLEVTVGNRGLLASQAVAVRAWACALSAKGARPWQALASVAAPPQAIPVDGTALARLTWPEGLAGRCLVLVAAQCEGDLANAWHTADLPTLQPLAAGLVQLTDLVANDNNLALALLKA